MANGTYIHFSDWHAEKYLIIAANEQVSRVSSEGTDRQPESERVRNGAQEKT